MTLSKLALAALLALSTTMVMAEKEKEEVIEKTEKTEKKTTDDSEKKADDSEKKADDAK